MLKNFFIAIVFFWFFYNAFATHNKAGEITYKHLYWLTYQITITTYADTGVLPQTNIMRPDRAKLELKWGDGTSDTVNRSNGPVDVDGIPSGEFIGNTKLNKYIANHTYPGAGVYIISFEDPTRVNNIVNISNSENVPFYVETVLLISPDVGTNNSPVLLQPPLDNGCVGQIFIHNPNAYDPDGDSLSYKLVYCKGANGEDIYGYSYPSASKSFSMDNSGNVIWNAPKQIGKYNIAFRIEEWRNGIKIGYVTRDMQVIIDVCQNIAPEIENIHPICVEAGDSVSFKVHANDINDDDVILTATGGPLILKSNPAKFTQNITGTGNVTGSFIWNTSCEHLQKQPYQVVFKAEDDNDDGHLVDMKTVSIRIVAPALKNLSATPDGNSIVLRWDKYICNQATGYKIFRRNGAYSGTLQCPCETGVPDTIGYLMIAEINNIGQTTFSDNNNGLGLIHGVDYCYLVAAVFPDSTLSCASNQVCAKLKKTFPVITHVDIRKTDASKGIVYIEWSKPTELDTVLVPGPYKYLIYRSSDFFGNNLVLIDSVGMLNGLNDTILTDSLVPLNTASSPYSYRVDLYNLLPSRFYVGSTQVASSVFLSIAPTDNRLNLSWTEQVPWNNYRYVVYRLNTTSGLFDSIAGTTTRQYSDTGLLNGISYCYKIKSIGEYSADGFNVPFINFSQEACEVPVDNVPPCAPDFTVTPDCINFMNTLKWNNPNNFCADDVLGYNIYFTASKNGDMKLIAKINSPLDTVFVHDSLKSIAGCYLVTSFDSVFNESKNFERMCADNCPEYVLPDIFTPDGQGKNEFFRPFPYRYVQDVDVKIFNRWGQQVFHSTDPEVNWEGRDMQTKKECPDGVYYYICVVNSIRLEGIKPMLVKGFVQLLRNKN